ncbi:hypothetical protein [Paracoccus sp. (in: a-proteobacteria)]|uniref:hypothetical protein n=1 Tax=Paracoccus sp. TaxID=267 RepID=UPI002AFF0991|nr:hypothetical protein [Paracoccus sp. (in: a-proteobacteria)]
MAAALIAVYAMIGGAFINAAITSPKNCLRVLSSMWGEIYMSLLLTGMLFLVAGIVMAALGSGAGLGVAGVGAAHVFLFGLFYLSLKIAQEALPEGLSEPKPIASKEEPPSTE